MKCPVCNSEILLKVDGWIIIKSAYCSKCGVEISTRVIGLTVKKPDFPFWKPLTNEVCGTCKKHYAEKEYNFYTGKPKDDWHRCSDRHRYVARPNAEACHDYEEALRGGEER